MAGNVANLALDGTDPRGVEADPIHKQHALAALNGVHGHSLHDSSVTFEEYLYYAKISRSDERFENPQHDYVMFGKTLKKASNPNRWNTNPTAAGSNDSPPRYEKEDKELGRVPTRMNVSDDEIIQASRAVRSATWGAVFYLITTDILGPYSTAWAFAAMGYGPGTVLYTIFGALAAYGGFLLWRMFLALDSDRYPLRTYGDIAFRVFGTVARHTVNFLQSFQLLFNVGIIIVANGLGLVQIATGSNANAYSCFIIMCFIWAIAGMLFGQIRTLAKLGWLANAAIWMNLFVIFMTMGIVGSYPDGAVNKEAAAASSLGVTVDQPIMTSANIRPGTDFQNAIVGLMQAVYSYGGAMLFIEFMAEMKRPFDFWKGMICAQAFIYIFYMFFGLFVYSYQGQFAVNPAYQGISNSLYAWQTTGNAISLVTGLIAALLYGNVGAKVIYNNIFMDFLKFPDLGAKRGKLIWIAWIPIYWAIAFIVAAAVPQVSNLGAFIAAVCILQFSYTFPPAFMLGFQIKKDAMLEGDGFNPETGLTVRADSGFSRFLRGYKRRWLFNTFNVIIVLGSLATAVLGTYSSIINMVAVYALKPGSSFSCQNPYAPPAPATNGTG